MKEQFMKMLNIFFFAVFSLVFVESGYCQSQNILILTRTGNYMPYQQEVKNVFTGIYIDVIRAAAQKMGVTISIKAVPLKRAKAMIETGKADAVFPTFEDSQMADSLYFSEEPLALEEISLFATKKNAIRFDGDLLSITHFRVGQVLGAYYGEEWNSMNFKKRSTNVSLKGLLKQLKSNRVDILIGTKYIVEHVAKTIKVRDDIVALEPSLIVKSSYLAFAKVKGISHRKLADEFDFALRTVKKSPQYMNIINKYLKDS